MPATPGGPGGPGSPGGPGCPNTEDNSIMKEHNVLKKICLLLKTLNNAHFLFLSAGTKNIT